MKTATERSNSRIAYYDDLLANSVPWSRTTVSDMLEDIDALFDIADKINVCLVTYVNPNYCKVYELLRQELLNRGYYVNCHDHESITICY